MYGHSGHRDGRQRYSGERGSFNNDRGGGGGRGYRDGHGHSGHQDGRRRPFDGRNSFNNDRGRGGGTRGGDRHYTDAGGRRQRVAGGQSNVASRPTECMVATNNYPLKILDPEKNQADFASYKVEIYNAKNIAKKDEIGQLVKDFSGRVVKEFTPDETKNICTDEDSKRFFTSPQPERIFKKLVADEVQKNPNFLLFVSSAISFSSILILSS